MSALTLVFLKVMNVSVVVRELKVGSLISYADAVIFYFIFEEYECVYCYLCLFQGIYFGHETPRMKNFHTFDELSDSIPIAGISWVDDTQKEILVAFKTGTIKVYNTKLRAFTSSIKLASEGEVVGVFAYEK